MVASACRCRLCFEVLLLASVTPMGMDAVSWVEGYLFWVPVFFTASQESQTVCSLTRMYLPPPPLAFVGFFGHQITENLSTGDCTYPPF